MVKPEQNYLMNRVKDYSNCPIFIVRDPVIFVSKPDLAEVYCTL
jgi:hypothetical protein